MGILGRHAAGAVVLALAAAALAAPAPATAGQIVWSKGSDIWVMNDDGSNQRVLIPVSAAPGMKSLDSPHVQPGGATIAFEGSTDQFKTSRTDLCGTFPYQYPCTTYHFGFNSTAVYTWERGNVERHAPAASYCWNCTDGLDNPEVRGDGAYVAQFMHCQGFLGDMSYECLGAIRSTSGETYEAACDLPDDPSPNPSAPGQVAYGGCSSGGDHAVVVTGPGRAGEHVVACDDATQEDPSWSSSGDRIVTAEGGTDPGLWVYGAGNTICYGGELRYALIAPSGVAFSSPRYVGADRIVFEAQGELWTVAAGCDHCAFPDAATKLTSGGDNGDPAWTSLASFPSTSGPTPGGDTVAPRLADKTARRQHVGRQRNRLVLRLRADERSTVTIATTVVLPGKDVKLRRVVRSLPAGRTVTIKVGFSPKALARIRRTWRLGRKAVAVLRLTLRDVAGNVRTSSHRVTLLR